MAEEVIVTEVSTPKSYTQAEVDALLQTESDRRVSDALKKADKKKQSEIQEAQKLARIIEAEKLQYELEQRDHLLKEKNLALMESKHAVSKILTEKGLPTSVADFLVTDNADTTKANIDAFEEVLKLAVKAEIEKRLSSGVPKRNVGESGMTREQFNKLDCINENMKEM